MAENTSVAEQAQSWPAKVKSYIEDLQSEMRKVTWPSKAQVQSTTVVVIVTVFAFAAYFAVIDGVIARLIEKLFHTFRQS